MVSDKSHGENLVKDMFCIMTLIEYKIAVNGL